MSSVRGDNAPSSAESASLDLPSESVEQTRRLGVILGGLLAPGDVVLLYGELGAGKTAFAQGIGRGLGVAATVNSPTFTILKEYMGRLPLYHFDLYRIESPDELYTLGFDEYFVGDGVCVVEWAERGEPTSPDAPLPWPVSYLRIELRAEELERRTLTATSAGLRGAALRAILARASAEDH